MVSFVSTSFVALVFPSGAPLPLSIACSNVMRSGQSPSRRRSVSMSDSNPSGKGSVMNWMKWSRFALVSAHLSG